MLKVMLSRYANPVTAEELTAMMMAQGADLQVTGTGVTDDHSSQGQPHHRCTAHTAAQQLEPGAVIERPWAAALMSSLPACHTCLHPWSPAATTSRGQPKQKPVLQGEGAPDRGANSCQRHACSMQAASFLDYGLQCCLYVQRSPSIVLKPRSILPCKFNKDSKCVQSWTCIKPYTLRLCAETPTSLIWAQAS